MPRSHRAAPPAFPPGVDFLTSHGAGILAAHIVAHWKAKGFAGITAHRYEVDGFPDVFAVTSNIGPEGFPPVMAS